MQRTQLNTDSGSRGLQERIGGKTVIRQHQKGERQLQEQIRGTAQEEW